MATGYKSNLVKIGTYRDGGGLPDTAERTREMLTTVRLSTQ